MPKDLTPYTSNRLIRLRFYRKISFCKHAKSCQLCCWNWLDYTDKVKRGIFHVIDKSKTQKIITVTAARFMWTLRYGHTSLQVNHICDNASCVNFNHLYSGTQLDNMTDRVKRGRMPQGETHKNSRLTNEDIFHIFYLREQGYSHYAIAAMMNTARSNISSILGGKAWKHLTRESL